MARSEDPSADMRRTSPRRKTPSGNRAWRFVVLGETEPAVRAAGNESEGHAGELVGETSLAASASYLLSALQRFLLRLVDRIIWGYAAVGGGLCETSCKRHLSFLGALSIRLRKNLRLDPGLRVIWWWRRCAGRNCASREESSAAKREPFHVRFPRETCSYDAQFSATSGAAP